jgi:hypothetical protein
MHTQKWEKCASKLLKAELAKRDISYIQLKEKLAVIGVEKTTSHIGATLSRGTFSAVFLLQCLLAIGIKNLQIDDSIFEETE